VHRQVGAFGQVLAERAVGVIVRSALPGLMRVAEIHCNIGGDVEVGMVGHLLGLVPGGAAASSAGSVLMAWRMACSTRCAWRPPGTCSSKTNWVVRLARVPVADLQSLPMIRSPSVRLSEARGGPGVAEVALRSGRLLGMSARLFLGHPDCSLRFALGRWLRMCQLGAPRVRQRRIWRTEHARASCTGGGLGGDRRRQEASLGLRG
jgi:hypothetical protein